MKINKLNGQIWKVALVFAAVLAWAAIPFLTQDKVSANGGETPPILIRTANLVSPTGSINPHGAAEYQLYANGNRELEVEIEDVNLPIGTSLNAIIDGTSAGQMVIDADQKAKLKLRTEDGQSVPTTNDGSTVQVKNGDTVLVAGVLNGGGPNPTPSPSASPTASPTGSPSPTVSPTATPTGSPSPSPSPTGSPSNESEIFAGLRGTINGVVANGYAAYEIHSSRREFEARINQLTLPSGTSLTFIVDGVTIGQTSVSGNEVRLRLRTDRGETVPVVTVGSTVQVQNNGTTVLSGTFVGSANPTPSPTPTGSPSPSPSPSPSAGRYFEAHATGAQVVPPITTAGNAEIKVFLSADETQATITGEFHGLSSTQTGAKIETTVGANTLIYDFGAIGGTNGRFANATITVNQAQVQQLRTGLWFTTVSTVNNPNGEVSGRLIQHGNGSDFDGDGSNDFAVFRPATGTWFSQNASGFSATSFGNANDKLVSGDYDGDGKADVAVYKNVNGSSVWEIKRSSDGGVTAGQFGISTDLPARGDFDGDGRNDLAVFRPSNGVWYIQNSSNITYTIVQFGISTDIPVASDMDGDGKDDIVVYRPSEGNWYWLNSSNGQFGAVHFGANGDIPVVGDFDGDGKQDFTVYRPSNGVWYTLRSSDSGFQAAAFGTGNDIPVAGNYDGDNKTDIAVFRPSTGIWYVLRSSDSTFQGIGFGTTGDIPAIAR